MIGAIFFPAALSLSDNTRLHFLSALVIKILKITVRKRKGQFFAAHIFQKKNAILFFEQMLFFSKNMLICLHITNLLEMNNLPACCSSSGR
jgi:hypothetical protein